MLFHLQTEQLINSDIHSVWKFISDANNLAKITPPYMNFRILNPTGEDAVYAGKIIEYNVSPVLGIPLYWVTEITHVKENAYFVDEQREGPYSFWHHQHHIKETPQGVAMTDIIHYRLPLGFIGRMGNTLFVKNQLQRIFDYRFEVIANIFK